MAQRRILSTRATSLFERDAMQTPRKLSLVILGFAAVFRNGLRL